MIAIIDYGMGNLHSACKALQHIGCEAVATAEPTEIMAADRIILPGVGAFGDAMANINARKLAEPIRQAVARGTPLLGICLGLQLLFTGSDEAPGIRGLGLLSGQVRKITAPGCKIPQMGWNSLVFKTPSPLFAGLGSKAYVYFVHSYHAVPRDSALITAVTAYGDWQTAAVRQGNVYGVQFHPEKSGSAGLKILRNFKELI